MVKHHLVRAGAAFEAVLAREVLFAGRELVERRGGYDEHVAAGGADWMGGK